MSDTRFIDTHAHLQSEQFAADRAQAMERAEAAGVGRMIEIGYDLASSRAALALAEQHEHIFAVVGIQPNFAAEFDLADLALVREVASHRKVVGIGEIGFDFYWKKAPLDVQEALFRAQLTLADELGLPVIIHSREAHAETLRVLRERPAGQTVVMHSFSGDWAYAQECLAIGLDLSLSGPVTFSKARELHEVAQRVPLDRLLTETDSPYLAPNPFRGKRNEPAHVRLVAERIAALREQPVAEVAAAVWMNAERIFDFSGHS